MPTTSKAATLHLTLPEHVITILDDWAARHLQATPEEVLEALGDSLSTNEHLRQYAAKLVAQGWRNPCNAEPFGIAQVK
jgi:hypothetical protein